MIGTSFVHLIDRTINYYICAHQFAIGRSRPSRPICRCGLAINWTYPSPQAIATTAPDLPPVPGRHASFARDREYKRHGTLSLLAGIDLLTGKVHALVRERHRSREFIEFLYFIAVSDNGLLIAGS
jgi:hypothetical protein